MRSCIVRGIGRCDASSNLQARSSPSYLGDNIDRPNGGSAASETDNGQEILGRFGNNHGHWVGDGFPVRSLFSDNDLGAHISPFLLLDYAGPHVFAPTSGRRGVGQHPHRGFETVTIVYDGEVEHRDSAGNGGIIGPGDVQWMTAGGGILHEEYHSPAFAKTGGPFRMVQLWVNLPAKDKMTPGGYQAILDAAIPVVDLAEGAGKARVIAGELSGPRGRRRPSRRSTSGISRSTPART